MARQLSLKLEDTITKSDSDDRIIFEPIHVSESTFLNGLSAHIHRWFRLTPSFGPELVREMLSKLSAEKGDYILDPFSGAGTTMIESSLEGFDSLGFEINPFLYFVNRVTVYWNLDPSSLTKSLNKISHEYRKARRKVTFCNLEDYAYHLPPIHNPTRWWRPDILVDLLVLKECTNSVQDSHERDFFLLALASVLVPDLTNVTLGRLQLHFINRDNDQINTIRIFCDRAEEMIQDIEAIKKLTHLGQPEVLLQNATDLSSFSRRRKVDCVITSPPYPNRYSYVWNTRPHLYLLDFFKTPKEASALDKKTIGGTWGTATSELQRGEIFAINDAVRDAVGGAVSSIREVDNLMANYAIHYFNRIAKQIIELEKIASPNLRVAYVVGNSRLKGVYIETDVILGEIFERLNLGYSVSSIHRFRKRHSGKNLFESVVYAAKR